jgi:hypothetical protein
LRDVAPDYLVACVYHLALVVEDPLGARLLHAVHVVAVPVADDAFHSFDHLFLHVDQPDFDVVSHAHWVDEFYHLLLWAEHAIN